MKKIYFLLLAVFASGCISITPMGSTQQTDSSESLMKYLEARELKQTPPMLQMDSTTMLAMSPQQLEAFMRGVSNMQQNIPQNTESTKSSTTNETESSSTFSQKESILITAIGSLIMLLVIIFGIKWFKSTSVGRLATTGINAVVGHLDHELEELSEKMKRTSNADEIHALTMQETELRRKKDKYISGTKFNGNV